MRLLAALAGFAFLCLIISIAAHARADKWPPKTMSEAAIYCEHDPDTRESGAKDEHLISVEECAKRILHPLQVSVARHLDRSAIAI
jgi:hypothetical protein